jgi:hypothetical protein
LPQQSPGPISDGFRANLAASLRRIVTDVSQAADALASLATDDEIEQQAKILEHAAEDASEGAAILWALTVRRGPAQGLSRRVPRDGIGVHGIPPGPGGQS